MNKYISEALRLEPLLQKCQDRKDFPFQGAEVPICLLEVLVSHHIGLGGEPPLWDVGLPSCSRPQAPHGWRHRGLQVAPTL